MDVGKAGEEQGTDVVERGGGVEVGAGNWLAEPQGDMGCHRDGYLFPFTCRRPCC